MKPRRIALVMLYCFACVAPFWYEDVLAWFSDPMLHTFWIVLEVAVLVMGLTLAPVVIFVFIWYLINRNKRL